MRTYPSKSFRIGMAAMLLALMASVPLMSARFSAEEAAEDWRFTEHIIDENPLADKRINDLALGDINGDGLRDIWVSGRNGSDHQAAWYRNPGERAGSWERLPYLKGSWKYGALGDIDGDGDLDIVAGADDEKKVYWLENDGTPEGDSWTRHFMGSTGKPDQVLIGDMDLDGQNEVVALFKGGPIQILDAEELPGGWRQINITETPSDAAGGSLGDLDGDGDPDIVFGNAWYENPLPDRDWTVGRNWISRTIDSGWANEARSCVADIDLDGRNDVVLTGEESADGVAWYRNEDPKKAGDWHRVMVNAIRYEKLHTCQVADFNNDGRPDIFVAEMHTSAGKRLTVFEQGLTSDEWIEHVVATTGAHNAKLADMDGDGRVDIVSKNFEGDMRPRVWFNNIAPTLSLDRWQRHIVETSLPHRAVFIRAGDLNGDGLPDLVAGAWWWPNPGSVGGQWKRADIGAGLKDMAVLHDFDADGDSDILGTAAEGATEDGHGFVWGENDGSGTFRIRDVGPPADGDFLQGAEAGRLPSATETAVVLSWHNGARTTPAKGSQWFRVPADPDQAWTWERIHDFSNEEQIALGDIDGDGHLDIHSGSHWLRNSGDGHFTLREAVKLSGGEPDRVRLADIDGDGRLDVVIGAESDERLVWARNPGGAGPWTEQIIATDFRHMSLDVGDLDGDGDIDVVSGAHKGGGEVYIYENRGEGQSWIRHIVDAGGDGLDHHDGTQLVDLDGDGDLDIISIGWQRTNVVIYENLAIHGPAS